MASFDKDEPGPPDEALQHPSPLPNGNGSGNDNPNSHDGYKTDSGPPDADINPPEDLVVDTDVSASLINSHHSPQQHGDHLSEHNHEHHEHHEHHHEHHQHQPHLPVEHFDPQPNQQQTTPPPTSQFDSHDATVAHHGLQALQEASAAPSLTEPVTTMAESLAQQYAQSAIQMEDSHISAQHAVAAAVVVAQNQHQHQHQNHQHQQQHYHQQQQQQQQQQQHTPPLNHVLPLPPLSYDANMNGNVNGQQKVTRLRRACDMCSQRKVKCDESGPPCKPCSDLQVECTFNRATKRRGPPNKHAEAARAAKRVREGGEMNGMIAVQHSPNSVPMPPPVSSIPEAAPSAGIVNGLSLDAESIAPWPVLELLVDDFFTYIHPLTPFPHEPTFRQAFANRADRSSREFLALLASMMGILVSSFPRSARAHLKAQQRTDLFPTAMDMIEQCRNIALQARGPFFMASEEMTMDAAATSYFLGLTASQTLHIKMMKRFMSETIAFCREIHGKKAQDASSVTSASEPINHIEDQISKRIFWVLVAAVRSCTQAGAAMNELPLPPPTAQEPYPDQPLEVDDEYIFADHIQPQPPDVVPLIAGFNRNIRIYTTMNELVGVDMCYGINFFDWTAQKNILSNGLTAAKQATDDLPPSLRIHMEGDDSGIATFNYDGWHYRPPTFPAPQPLDDVRHAFVESPTRRRLLQLEIQKANIYASQLATRSYFVERYLTLRENHQMTANLGDGGVESDDRDDRDAMVADERELIVRNLMTVLGSINERNMEPNGNSIVFKMRQVASTLVNDPSSRKGPNAQKAEATLTKIFDLMMKLERTSSAPTHNPLTSEEELQVWASLREHQIQFMANGGFMSH